MWNGPVGFAEIYSRIIFSVCAFSGRPKFSFLSIISFTRFVKSVSPALKLIKPATTVYSLSSLSINSKIEFAIIGGAILAFLASDDTFIAKSPKSGFLGRSTISEPFWYSVICPTLPCSVAFINASSTLFKK